MYPLQSGCQGRGPFLLFYGRKRPRLFQAELVICSLLMSSSTETQASTSVDAGGHISNSKQQGCPLSVTLLHYRLQWYRVLSVLREKNLCSICKLDFFGGVHWTVVKRKKKANFLVLLHYSVVKGCVPLHQNYTGRSCFSTCCVNHRAALVFPKRALAHLCEPGRAVQSSCFFWVIGLPCKVGSIP